MQVTWVINLAVGCHYFPPGLQLPPQPLRGLLPVLLLGEQRHNGGWTVCLKLLPDSVAAAIWTRAFCAWVQHANHSSTEPPTLLYHHFTLCIFPGNPAQLVWCRYDHLTRLLTKILDERPSNAVDVFEDFSRNVKEARFVSGADNLQDRPDASAESRLAETQLSLFTVLHCIALQQDYLLWPR